jgi:hypothetical protein
MALAPRISTILQTTLLLAASQATVIAGEPQLAFDFSRVAECVDVSSEAQETLYAGEKLVELKLRVSVHLLSGKIGDVEEVRIELGDADNRLRVHSFSPGTKLTSNYSDDIEWTRTTDDSRELGASLGGELPTPIGGLIANVTPSISGGTTNREKITEKQLRVAPRFAVVASGTIAQGHGVFFKLRSSPQTSLEGTHEFAVRFIVPAKWRGDAIRVCCQATGTEKVLWMTQQATWAHTCGGVAMYMAGDAKARQAAIRFVDSRG